MKENPQTITLERKPSAMKHMASYSIIKNGVKIGNLELAYHRSLKECRIADVEIYQDETNKGHGKTVYKRIPFLPTPIEGDFVFVSSPVYESTEGLRVWQSLEKDGLAFVREDGRYQMVPS